MADEETQVYGGRYELHRRIARGGMADVFLARDSLLDRPVALKVLFPEFATDPSFVERFRREAQAAANLSHPNIVSVYDWGEEGGTYYIVMEYVEGRSLAQILRDEGPLLPDRAADVTTDIASALGFAHRHGVIHRDVKPGNVLISPLGQVKVTDFGIARAVSTQENLTQTGTVMGTATYFSPEQARGESVDPRSDVYSLGVVLYELLAGAPPFKGDNPVSVAYKHVQEQPDRLRSRNPQIPVALEAVAMKALAKNPANRYASAEDFAADLRRFRDGRSVTAETLMPDQDVTQIGAPPTAGATRVVSSVEGTQAMPATAPDRHEPPRRPSAALPIIVALLAIILIGGLFALLNALSDKKSGDQVTVPAVVDLPREEATQSLTNAGFKVSVEQDVDSDKDENTVLSQDPAGGTKADEGSTVRIVVNSSQPKVEVPSLVGKQRADAETLLRKAGLVADVTPKESDRPEGEVLSQDPEAGKELPRSSVVKLTVSSGPTSSIVPKVADLGLTPQEAAAKLQDYGFSSTFERIDSDEPEDTVLGTDPAAGTEAPRGSEVVIFLSNGHGKATTTSSSSSTSSTSSTSSSTTSTTIFP